jgi:hypothetical protein
MARKKKTEDAAVELALFDPTAQLYIPSGCTLLDLACTDTDKGFCQAGHTINIIGDRNSGKTAASLACMAETEHRYPGHFAHKFIDYEQAMSFDVKGLYGRKFAERFEHVVPEHSLEWCVESLATKIIEDCKKGPHIFVLDSFDVILTEVEMKAVLAGKPLPPKVYGGPMAKASGPFFATVCSAIARSGSFLIVLSQARPNVGFGSMFKPKTRNGGVALGYYAYIELWVAPGPIIKKGNVKVGQWVMSKVERSKANGKKRTVMFPILPSYGVDNTRAEIDWLIEEKVIKVAKGAKEKIAIEAADDGEEKADKKPKGEIDLSTIGLDYVGKNPYLFVETTDGAMQVLRDAVVKRWTEKEAAYVEAAFGGRKGRYE